MTIPNFVDGVVLDAGLLNPLVSAANTAAADIAALTSEIAGLGSPGLDTGIVTRTLPDPSTFVKLWDPGNQLVSFGWADASHDSILMVCNPTSNYTVMGVPITAGADSFRALIEIDWPSTFGYSAVALGLWAASTGEFVTNGIQSQPYYASGGAFMGSSYGNVRTAGSGSTFGAYRRIGSRSKVWSRIDLNSSTTISNYQNENGRDGWQNLASSSIGGVPAPDTWDGGPITHVAICLYADNTGGSQAAAGGTNWLPSGIACSARLVTLEQETL